MSGCCADPTEGLPKRIGAPAMQASHPPGTRISSNVGEVPGLSPNAFTWSDRRSSESSKKSRIVKSRSELGGVDLHLSETL
jgi:hypothetical protein